MDHSSHTAPATAHAHDGEHGAAAFKSYMTIFVVLCVLTSVSFIFNELQRHGVITLGVSAGAILFVAVIKAVCVGYIFMHLKADWNRLYFIIIPVVIMAIMMSIVLLPDIVLAWHHDYFTYE